jgi:hypothetical protein
MADITGLPRDKVRRLAGLELNALLATGVLPPDLFDGARVARAGTEVYDLNGELLFHRIPVVRGRERTGYADVAAHPALGAPLLASSHGLDWNEDAIRKEAAAAARKRRRGLAYDRMRFVAYSYPKIGVQFLKGPDEVLLLEYGSWAVVPPGYCGRRKPLEPSNFERWSLLDELPEARKRANIKKFTLRLRQWERPKLRRFDATVLAPERFERLVKISFVDTRELHYSKRNSDHHACYELRGQQTNVWCVGASVQMLLDFYRYEYTQVRLAQELGLGTLASPNGLPYARVGDVVKVIEKLSSNALDATMVIKPTWGLFRNEIRANRPMISFIPGHSRTVAGYVWSLFGGGGLGFNGLLVYDPWPPNMGVITRWENFATQIYQYGYTAAVTLV